MVTGSVENKSSYEEEINRMNGKNRMIAFASSMLGVLLFVYNQIQPSTVSGVALLHAMEKDSQPLKSVVCNGKPTVIDFYADWCESCKAMAPSMREMEIRYKDSINFITINGVDPTNADLVDRFKVDGIPHLAFVSSSGELQTALIGAVPKTILKEQMDAFVGNSELPYHGLTLSDKDKHPLQDLAETCPADSTGGVSSNAATATKRIEANGASQKVQTASYISEELKQLLKEKSLVDVLKGV